LNFRHNEQDLFGNYLTGHAEPMSNARDEKNLKMQSLMNDYNNIR